ncbi:rhodanese-like domain-containing protein [Fulvivirga ligni]|uniref:rhodanese-like domain-containing protein n=1 Tax=Fulvivirga ligni TaxID=2904246 RepID=UPI001F2AA475|nr:rhodanese-like domain-containing protein [Fulvivirga ligni]UII22896.1 rhodanese-like domain-containing protein [Fulvivirga ligni]
MKAYRNLNSKEFLELFNTTPDAVLLDVRTEKEFKAESFAEASNIPCTETDKLLALNKDKAYFIHCRMGGRSAMVAFTMSQAGFQNLYNLNEEFSKLKTEAKGYSLSAGKVSENETKIM